MTVYKEYAARARRMKISNTGDDEKDAFNKEQVNECLKTSTRIFIKIP
jgi:hypothetical protein